MLGFISPGSCGESVLQYLYSGRDNVAIGKLWLMAKHGVLVCRTYILAEDLEHFLEPEKAQQAFDILDVDGDGQVTLHNIRDAVVSIYQVTLCIYELDCLKTLPPRCCSEQLGIALQRQVFLMQEREQDLGCGQHWDNLARHTSLGSLVLVSACSSTSAMT